VKNNNTIILLLIKNKSRIMGCEMKFIRVAGEESMGRLQNNSKYF
jgi:hypothetical protein